MRGSWIVIILIAAMGSTLVSCGRNEDIESLKTDLVDGIMNNRIPGVITGGEDLEDIGAMQRLWCGFYGFFFKYVPLEDAKKPEIPQFNSSQLERDMTAAIEAVDSDYKAASVLSAVHHALLGNTKKAMEVLEELEELSRNEDSRNAEAYNDWSDYEDYT
jgi:hypothetical protein